MPYWLVKTGESGPGIDGGLHPRIGTASTDVEAVIGYVCTVDVPALDDYLKRATEAGASVCVPKMPISGVGWLAYCKDTEGNIFGMMQSDASAGL
jgi:predicted enzyme related to lactoylglutathione lyase